MRLSGILVLNSLLSKGFISEGVYSSDSFISWGTPPSYGTLDLFLVSIWKGFCFKLLDSTVWLFFLHITKDFAFDWAIKGGFWHSYVTYADAREFMLF